MVSEFSVLIWPAGKSHSTGMKKDVIPWENAVSSLISCPFQVARGFSAKPPSADSPKRSRPPTIGLPVTGAGIVNVIFSQAR